MPINKKELATIEKDVQTLTIANPDNMKAATELLSKINKFSDQLTDEKEKLTKPINEALKEIRARYKPTEIILGDAIAKIRSAMGAYQTAQIEIKRKEEAKLLAKVETGKLSLEKASSKLADIKNPDKKTVTDSGSVAFREDKILKILDAALIPMEFYDLNESTLLKALKAGREIPGATTEIVQIPVNRR